MTPNIMNDRERHKYCEQNVAPNWRWVREGDVRRCEHGVIQYAWHKYTNVTGCYWRDLSPVWNPVLYRRARKVLNQ